MSEIATPRYSAEKYKTPTGTTLNCKGWVQEAALRMLLPVPALGFAIVVRRSLSADPCASHCRAVG